MFTLRKLGLAFEAARNWPEAESIHREAWNISRKKGDEDSEAVVDLDRVIRAAYRLLGLQTFFTAGPKEVRAWTVRTGATAPQAAGVIHTDFEHGFIVG